jgi:hypothetical protein
LIASWSSKSLNRFLVNFQMKNAMIPIAATPPATERPIIEPVPRPLEVLALEVVLAGALAVALAVVSVFPLGSTGSPAESVAVVGDAVVPGCTFDAGGAALVLAAAAAVEVWMAVEVVVVGACAVVVGAAEDAGAVVEVAAVVGAGVVLGSSSMARIWMCEFGSPSDSYRDANAKSIKAEVTTESSTEGVAFFILKSSASRAMTGKV